MSTLKQLTPQDAMFIGAETPSVYQHTAGLALMDASDRPGFGFEVFRQQLAERIALVPHFHWKLHEVPLGLDLPYWVEDEHFSYDNHIRRIAVPSPGDREALSELAAYLYCRHLDRSRPLWEIWFIEGLGDGQYALFQKLHHCLMDGEGASKLAAAMCDFAPDAPPPKPDPHIADARPGEVPQQWRQSLNAASHLAQLPMRASREVYEAVRHSMWQRLTQEKKTKQRPHVPMTVINGSISRDRGLVFGSLPLADVKAVKQHFDVTVNDVMLAVVSGSLRDYLLARGALPEESLRTSMAVSLRTDQDDEFSNRITTVGVTLATDLEDPAQRLRAIAAETGEAKREAHSGGKSILDIVQILPPVMVHAMLNMAPPDQIIEMAGVNVIVSNVRGSPNPMYVGGARIVATYPMSIIAPGGGVNITCLSYTDKVDCGITIEPNMVPEPWTIIDGLHKALDEYVALVKKDARRGKKAARSRATKKRATSRGKAAPKPKSSGGKKTTRKRAPAAKKR